ncbi:hypothetical protein BGW38_005937 [Lunasporangiospora selenospora]|uniref:Glycosyltransferase sugar-binding region containing DXD motif-containing protein n=1 Tax=Lunasporangiospora selenospora TaxID=979761 RepID=A0A9P6FZA4_9FUNG|nr:hypothetical protein BGW38_005937 [Lunasporangiospora selenospora]
MHLSDYLLLVALYKYGGLYMDMDALWTRAPQDRMTEFIGADLSDSPEDLSWALDDQNNYLATGLMRFQRGRAMFRHIAERYFTITTYDPSCFNCYGPKAFTQYVKSHQQVLISNGMQILPREGLYPYNWKEAEGAIKKTRPPVDPEQELVRIEERGIGLHLYGKVTSKKPIEDGSVVAEALRIWALELFETSSSPSAGSVEQRLQGPRVLYYTEMPPQRSGKPLKSSTTSSATEAGIAFLEKTPGAFQGLDAIFIRGSGKIAPAASKGLITKKASLHITIREGSVTMDPFVPLSLASFSKSPATATSKTNRGSAGARKIEMDLGDDVTMAQLNLALSRIRYLPPSTSSLSKAWGGTDEILIRVVFGELQKELVIPVVRKAGQRL